VTTPTLARRSLRRGSACALAAVAAPPRFLARAALAADGRRKVLVAVFQRGAVDGLSMVVPYGDRDYAGARASIAIRPPRAGDAGAATDLDGFFGLHPALAPLQPLWQSRALAVVHACGSPDTTRSHFDAQDYMESGTPGVKSTPDRKSTRLNSSHGYISYAVFCLKKKTKERNSRPTAFTEARARVGSSDVELQR